MNVSLYRCFKSDKRISMEVYADGVHAALAEQGIKHEQIMPTSLLERWHTNSWVMRYLRYRYYSCLVKKIVNKPNQIHHVTDHGYAHLLPYLGEGKKVISVHDLIPLLAWKKIIKLDQNGATLNARKPSLNLYSLKFIQGYDQIITISQSTANDLQHYLGIDAQKISVIPPVVDDAFRPIEKEKIDAFRDKYQLDANTKWLMVSGQEYYKNHQTSLLVLQSLLKRTNKPIKIIKTGRPTKEFDRLVAEYGLQKNVEQRFLDSADDLPALYNMVECLLFPSTYEGFGMPVTEALACGTPVVMSNSSALPEAGYDLAIKHDCFDVQSMTDSVERILNDQSIRQHIHQQQPNWSLPFRVKTIASSLKATYAKI